MDDNPRYILTIERYGSISEAARHAHISQPALSQRLKQVEGRMGVSLFDRGTSPLKATQAGEVYIAWARKAVDSEAVMNQEVRSIANKTTRRLRIGTSVPRGNVLLPDIIERFYAQSAGCTVFVYEAGMPESHNSLLADGDIEFAIFTPVRPESSLFSGEPVCAERMLYVAPASWGVSTCDGRGALPTAKIADIAQRPFIMPPQHLKHSRIIRGMMDAASVKLNVSFHSCSTEMTLEMIRRGIGASIMPNTFVCDQMDKALSLYAIDACPHGSSLFLNWLDDKRITPDGEAFIEIAKSWVSEHRYLAIEA